MSNGQRVRQTLMTKFQIKIETDKYKVNTTVKGSLSLYFFALEKGEGDVQRTEGEANPYDQISDKDLNRQIQSEYNSQRFALPLLFCSEKRRGRCPTDRG